ncbi:hypothetical protein [Chromobacterium sphagni]|uniref:hypothetical protein n=1 Tax=Chromobacterium sphagni TaxID=1903179 RepID=UPI00111406C7|nr:hypothetical protein [Chromobacterium sphagni]
MNIAFPAIFLFLIISPGFFFRHHKQRSEVRNFDHSPFSVTALQAILSAFIINGFVLYIARPLGYEIELGDLVCLLTSSNCSKNLTNEVSFLNSHPNAILLYFISTHALGILAALTWREIIVRYFKLERRGCCLSYIARGSAPWYYLFKGLDHSYDPDGVVISAVISLKDCSILYMGLLYDYTVNDAGELDRIMINGAQRRKFENDGKYNRALKSFKKESSRFYPINGDILILPYSQISTLNISYLKLSSAEEDGS